MQKKKVVFFFALLLSSDSQIHVLSSDWGKFVCPTLPDKGGKEKSGIHYIHGSIVFFTKPILSKKFACASITY